MFERYRAQISRLVHAAIHSPGSTSPALRQSVVARGKEQTGATNQSAEQVQPEIAELTDKVILGAHDVRDEDMALLHATGYSDDAILEVVNCAALAAGLARLDIVAWAMERREGDETTGTA